VHDAQYIAQQLALLQHRLSLLHQQLADRSPSLTPPLPAVIEDLQTALEELRVADEALRQQHDALAQAYTTIAAERQRYQELFEGAPDGYLVTDTAGIIIEANRAAAALLAVRQDRLVGKPLAIFVVGRERRVFRARLASTVQEQRRSRSWELWLCPRGGEPFYAALRVAPLHDLQGVQRGFQWSIRDLTEHKRTEETLQYLTDTLAQQVAAQTAELSQANTALKAEILQHRQAQEQLERQQEALAQQEKLAAMSSLLANVAHELNNPLAVVMIQADLLREEADNSPLAAYADEITQAAERCVEIVHHFLALARQQPPMRTEVDLNTVIAAAMRLLAYPLQVDTITVTLHLDPDIPPLWADPHQLQQVVVNLVTNAHQALRESTGPRQLTLTTRVEPALQRVVLEVADTGPGIPPAIQQRLFEPFFTAKPPGVGTGLGLSLCLGIVEGHGGTIHIESAPGQGAVFRVALPIEPIQAKAEIPASVALPGVQPKTILIVDDEPGLARALARLLQRDGHTVETVANGHLALERCQSREYDLILCDLRMPELDGPGFYQELQRRHPHLCTRVVFLTGDTLSPEALAFLEHTGVPQMTKPFTAAMIRQVIRRL